MMLPIRSNLICGLWIDVPHTILILMHVEVSVFLFMIHKITYIVINRIKIFEVHLGFVKLLEVRVFGKSSAITIDCSAIK